MFKLYLITAMLVSSFGVHGDEDLEKAWENYKSLFPMAIKSRFEVLDRKSNFEKTHTEIKEHNENKDATFVMEHNTFSVMDEYEKRQFINPFPLDKSIDDEGSINFHELPANELSVRQSPTLIDFRTHNCLQPVRNQGNCGSCWAFAATTVVEFQKCVQTGTKVALSEQHLVDCNTVNWGCSGGWYHTAWRYLASAGGQATAASYPYTAAAGTCKFSSAVRGATLSTTSPLTVIAANGTNAMMNLLNNNRLISVVFNVVNSIFTYKSGVYTEPNCGTNVLGSHAVVVVGYGSLSGIDYWIIRNSWGGSWGASGYVLFRRGVNLCGVEQMAASANVIA